MDETLLRHLGDLAERAEKTGFACSKFLNPAEQEYASRLFPGRFDVSVGFSGGFEGAERRVMYFSAAWNGDHGELVSALTVSCRKADSLSHRDILGALMALGIKREVLGDILCGYAPPAYIICLPEMAEYIAEHFTRVGRTGVKTAVVSTGQLPAKSQEYRLISDTVASLRLDALTASAFGLSRGAAAALIESGHVSLSHIQCDNPAKSVEPGALISARGYGKAKFAQVGGTSKKGRIWIEMWRYV